MDKLVEMFSYFVLVSVAAERITEIIKLSLFNSFKPNGVVYQVISGSFGGYLAYNMPPDFLLNHNKYLVSVLVGLAVSGGSGAWNSALEALANYSKSIKGK